MRIQNETKDLSEPKTLKVSLPARLHLKLHSLKILSGTTISDTVEQALEEYFEEASDGSTSSSGPAETEAEAS